MSDRATKIIKGLYFITGVSGSRTHEEMILEALAGGVKLIQLRDKRLSKRELFNTAVKLRKITWDKGAAFIVNDDIEAALACGADGVHLGQDDLKLADARKIAGERLLIGVSTHSLDQAIAAEEGGADYIGFGPIFKTTTKDAGEAKGPGALKSVREKIQIPIVAIGGINMDNASEVIEAGANAVAVISAVSGAKDAALAARGLMALFNGRS